MIRKRFSPPERFVALVIGLLVSLLISSCDGGETAAPATPTATAEVWLADARAGRWGAVYDRLDERAQQDEFLMMVVLDAVQHGGMLNVGVEEIHDPAVRRKSFLERAGRVPTAPDRFLGLAITGAQREGDAATVLATRPDGEDVSLRLIRRHGAWRIAAFEDGHPKREQAEAVGQLFGVAAKAR